MTEARPSQPPPSPSSALDQYRREVQACLQANISTDALWALGAGALAGAMRGAQVGAEAGAPFEGVGAIPGALAGGLAGAAVGAANGGLASIAGDAAKCAILPNGAVVQ